MPNTEKTAAEFKEYTNKIVALSHFQSLAWYDSITSMPKGSRESWNKKMAIFGSEIFKMRISDELGQMIEYLSAHENQLDEITAAMVRHERREYEKLKRVPAEFSHKKREAELKAQMAWEKAKNENNFAAFAPYLEENIKLTKQYANYIAAGSDPFDALLDASEPGANAQMVDDYFAKLRSRIVPLLKKITESGNKIDTGFLNRFVSIETQKKISELMMNVIGYDLNRGELRETEHPFCSSYGKYDSRITTHYHENRFTGSLFAVLHECGHAMYEQNKDDKIANTVLDEGIMGAMHEAQSRFYENYIGRSREFVNYIFGDLKAILGNDFKDITADMFFEAINAVEPGLIRIQADELIYSLHIMIRYEIERMFIKDDINVMDLPKIWNDKIEEYIGIKVPDDKRGILQDVHWSMGLVGYFPSYSLGSAYGAQLLAAMKKDLNFEKEVAKGNIAVISKWLTGKVHKYGRMHLPQDILKMATGETFNPDYYIEYLENKFTKLYKL